MNCAICTRRIASYGRWNQNVWTDAQGRPCHKTCLRRQALEARRESQPVDREGLP